MSTGKWVLWSRQTGTDQEPKVRYRGSLAACRKEQGYLDYAAGQTNGAMPFPFLDMVVLPVGASPTAAFREMTPL